MTSDSDISAQLSEPLLTAVPHKQHQPQLHHDEADCESQSHSQASTAADSSRVISGDEADAAAGGLDPASSSQRQQTKMNGFVLAVILFFNASGTCITTSFSESRTIICGETHHSSIVPFSSQQVGPLELNHPLKLLEIYTQLLDLRRCLFCGHCPRQ